MAKSFSLTVDEQGIAFLVLETPGEKVNKLSLQVIPEITELTDRIAQDQTIRAVVLLSGKPDNFIAGADIEDFLNFTTAAETTALSRQGQQMIARLTSTRVPIVAAIHGSCLGGGLELALACQYRIITDSPQTFLGLPEVQLGLLPGMGGTQRLPRLVGVRAALDMILTGKNIYPRAARRMGLVDEVVGRETLITAAKAAALKLAGGWQPERKSRRGIQQLLLEGNPLGRQIIYRKAHEQVLKKTKGLYPAPLKALEAVERGLATSLPEGLKIEAELFGELAMTEVSRELINLFFAVTATKKDKGVSDPTVTARPVRKLGMMGAGFMGSGIAAVAIDKVGLPVRLKDATDAALGQGLKSCYCYLNERMKKRIIDRRERDRKLGWLSGTTDYSGFGTADLIIEAVFEDLTLKHQVIRELEAVTQEDCILASNTSSIPITKLAEASRRPENFLGMHFFSPVPKMPLLEIIVTKQTAPEVIATSVEFGQRLGKTVIVVNDGYGFYTSRSLGPYMNEGAFLLAEGGRIEEIDEALVQFGFPVGPLTLLDEVGLDVAAKVGPIMVAAFGERVAPPAVMLRVYEDGRHGRKNGRGFYRYEKGRKQGVDATVYDLLPQGRDRRAFDRAEIQERLSLAMLNEAALCLQEGILRSPRDGDIGAIFGLGFPPFRGGPFRYMDKLGATRVVERLQHWQQRYGARFTPAALLVEMAQHQKKFYPSKSSVTTG